MRRSLLALLALLAPLALSVAACSSTTAAPASVEASPAAPAPLDATADAEAPSPPPSPGCGLTPARTGLLPKQLLTAAGKEREFYVSVPATYEPRKPYAVVFVFHGATDTHPEAQREWFGVEKAAPPALFVYPQALPRTRADGTGGAVTRWDLDADEDLLFTDAILAELSATYCVQPGLGFATGFSSGGNFAQQLGCKRRSAIRAIGAVSGPGPFSTKCDGPLAVWMTHDADDTALPVAGARASRDFWMKKNGCGTELAQEPQPECKLAPGCPADAPVVYCESKGVGHAVAGYAPKAVADFFAPMMTR
jgi:poly(3-hydroxybutyrate) depolymerase